MSKMNKAVAAAVLAMGASAAQAGITIPAGEWTIDIGGNVNAFYTHSTCDTARTAAGAAVGIGAGLACGTVVNTDGDRQNIRTGLLPSALGIGGKSRQNDLDVAFQFTFFVGADGDSNSTSGSNALNGNSINIRQAYLTFGDKSWGTVKAGRDLGIFGSDAILSDMTLLGVGEAFGRGGSSTLGRIGLGYIYADWVGQISYASPNWNGFSFAVGVRDPWQTKNLAGVTGTNTSKASAVVQDNMGFEGKVSYEWGGDISGKVWAEYIHQNVDAATNIDNASAWGIGGKAAFSGFEAVGYYYKGDGAGTTGFLMDGFDPTGNARDSDGWYVQGTYKIPTLGTKIGVSYGESNLDCNGVTAEGAANCGAAGTLVNSNQMWTVGVYHPLTKSLNLVAEYSDVQSEAQGSTISDAEERTFSLGAIMFF